MQDRNIIIQPTPFKAPKVMLSPQGMTIKQIIDQMYDASGVPAIWRDYAVMVEVNGEPIPRDKWYLTPPLNAHVLISVPIHGGGGGGGKDPLRTLLSIAVVVAAVVLAAPTGGASLWLAGATGLPAATSGALIGLGVLTAGMLLVDAIAPIRMPSTDISPTSNSYSDSPTYSISGASNQANPFGPVPAILGIHKYFPLYGANPYTEIVGNDEYLRMLFVWGYGRLDISSIKIGDTLLSSYTDYDIETREGRIADDPITLIPNVVIQDSVGVTLLQVDGRVPRTAHATSDELSVDIIFPSGLAYFNDAGNRTSRQVQVKIEYCETETEDWVVEHTFTVTDATSSAVRVGHSWAVDRGKTYDVALTRITADTDNTRIVDKVAWSVLRSIRNDPPVNFSYPLAMTALKIKATEQLQGVIDSLNGIVSSYAPIWDGDEWGGEEITQNPAALYRLVLMHPANARPRTSTQINDANLGDWYDFCVTNGYKFNMVRDYTASVWATLADIAAAGRGSPTLTDGVWGVVFDAESTPVIQHITPRNSWGFQAEKTLFNRPHAFRVPFTNEEEDYEKDERIVYDDGYTAENATEFESIEFPGVTDSDLIWKFGRYHIAQARLRPETYSIYQDFEHLVCRRGSKVRVSHDVPMWGSGWGRVKTLIIDEGDPTKTAGVILDEAVVMEEGPTYGCRFRLADEDNTSLCLSVKNDTPGESATIMFQALIPIADGPQVNDLAMFGETDSETVECLVKRIERASDYTAKLILVDVAYDIYDADTGEIPAFITHITGPVDITRIPPEPPTIIGIDTGDIVIDNYSGVAKPRILVHLAAASGKVKVKTFRVRYRISGSFMWSFAEAPLEAGTVVCTEITAGETYEIWAQSISTWGIESAWVTGVDTEAQGRVWTPQTVTGFAANISATGTLVLSWAKQAYLEIAGYEITGGIVEGGSLAQKEMRISPASGYAGVYLPSTLDLTPYLGKRLIIKDSVLHEAIGYIKSIGGKAVNVTAGATASIVVADNDNIDFGTGNFTLIWRGSLPDWSIAGDNLLISKYQAGISYYLNLDATGKLLTYLNQTIVGAISKTTTNSLGLVDGTSAEIAVSIARETVSLPGSISVYLNGVLFESFVIAAGTPPNISNTTALQILGITDIRYAGTCCFAATFNRALTGSEVLDLYRNGIKFQHKWGSQTAQTSGLLVIGKEYIIDDWITDDDFTNVGGANVDGTIFVATGTTPTKWTNSSSLRPSGATLALEEAGIGDTDWQDSSTNNLDASYPAAGSAVVLFNNIVSTPGGTTYNWESIESGFNYNDASGYTYEIIDDFSPIAILNALSYRVGVALAGIYQYFIKAIDTSGNKSTDAAEADITIYAPSIPAPSAEAVGEWAVVTWESCKTSMPIAYYKVNTVQQSNSLRYTERIDWVGEKGYDIIAVDVAGNESVVGSTSLTVTALLAVTGIVPTGLTYAIKLALTYSLFEGFECVEIWASETNDRSTAKKVGETAATVWQHNGLNLIATRFYWTRTRDIYGNYGAWYPISDTAGTEASTSTDPDDYIAALAGYINDIAGVDLIVEGYINGNPAVGISGDVIIDGSILTRNIKAEQITADKIAVGVITADKFFSTLYGDMNQAMDYVKAVLSAGDEYSYLLTITDIEDGIDIDVDADTHIDYGLSIRLATDVSWDDEGAVWDTGSWDIPTKASGSWESDSMDLGELSILMICFNFFLYNEDSLNISQVFKAQYSIDDIDWGTNEPDYDDDLWETLSIMNNGGIINAKGSLNTFRYFKIKIEFTSDNVNKRGILNILRYLGNIINIFGMLVNQIIAIGGTTFDLTGFKTSPAITITPIGVTPLVPLITAQAADSVTIKLYNLAGADVGGNANLTIIGA